MAKHLIRTDYHDHMGTVIKSCLAKNPNSACLRAQNNLMMNTYGARSVEVYNIETAQMYANFIRRMNNKIETSYHYNPREFKDPIRSSMAALFDPNELAAIRAVLQFKPTNT